MADKGYLPCPFCGSKDIRTQEISKDNDYDIWCVHCSAGFDSCHSLIESVKKWNKRTPCQGQLI
jgi:Lar family restriction alleviation protein